MRPLSEVSVDYLPFVTSLSQVLLLLSPSRHMILDIYASNREAVTIYPQEQSSSAFPTMNAPFVGPRQAISLQTAVEPPYLLSNQANTTSFNMSALNPPSISPFTPPVYTASPSQTGASTSSNPILLRSSLTVYTNTTVPILWTPTNPGSKSPIDTDPIDLHGSLVTTRVSKASKTGGRMTTRRGWSFTGEC